MEEYTAQPNFWWQECPRPADIIEAVQSPSCPWWSAYPRPQLKRDSFLPLRGPWSLNGTPIAVPYPPESELSGFAGKVENGQLNYETSFALPQGFCAIPGSRVWLHFGAVDQRCAVFLNGRPAVQHEGGYLPFAADITDLLRPGQNTLTVCAVDELNHLYPYGKQKQKRGGMWYTPVSGIWQPVWLEAVPPRAVRSLRMTPDLHGVTLQVETDAAEYTVLFEGKRLPAHESTLRLTVDHPHLWTPEDPYLYRFAVETDTDRVESYFALRTVAVEGQRILLNGKPVFLHGVLDQGYFPGGHFLPESPAAYERDILAMKALGFNTLRKHIKIEPEAFYEACDRLGMLVLQDMVNSGGYTWLFDSALPTVGFKSRPDRYPGGRARKQFFIAHTAETQAHLYNHPCIVGYTIFNEGWGQFDADQNYARCKAADPTRFYDTTSGWFAQRDSDVHSEHIYFRNTVLRTRKNRPLLLSECGGYGYPVEGHSSCPGKAYSYGDVISGPEQLTDAFEALLREMLLPSIPGGLCGCIYTQLCDIEDEINGLYTFDRAVCKVLPGRMQALAAELLCAFDENLHR